MFFPLKDKNLASPTIIPYATYLILGINLLAFAYLILLEESSSTQDFQDFVLRFAMQPTALLSGAQKIWNLFSYSFLHLSFIHIFSNLWFFWVFSENVEQRLGSMGFLVFYLAAGACGALTHVLFREVSPLIGASGAIAGVLGAYIVLFPGNHITSYFCPIWVFIRRVDVPALVVLSFYFLFQFFAFFQSEMLKTNLAFESHMGGFLFGALVGWFMRVRLAPSDVALSSG